MKQKRIIIVTHRFYPLIGGAENQALLLAKNLVVRGNDVCVLTSKIDNALRSEIIDGVSIVRLNKYGVERNFHRFILLFNFRLLFYLSFRLRQFDKTLYFFAIDFFAISAFPLKWFGKETIIRTATPSASSEIGGNYKNGKFYKYRRFLISAFTKFIAITTEIESNLLNEGIEQNRIIRMNNGVDTSIFFPLNNDERLKVRNLLNLKEEIIYLLFCGHFYKTKGLDYLIDSLIELGKSHHICNTELLILGSNQSIPKKNSFEEDIIYRIRRSDFPIRINFLGQIYEREKYFQAADIFVLPSQSEGMPNALLEAMACGLACIATNVGGVIDIIQHEVTGYMVKYRDNKELGNAICELIRDEYLRKRIGKQAFMYIKAQNGIENVANEYERVFKNLL